VLAVRENMKLEGRNALITGASQGLGKEIAKQFLAEGAKVTICARDAKLLEETRAELAGSDRQIAARACDVSSESEVNALVQFAEDKFGPIDILVSNAGIYGPMGPSETVDWREWTRTIEINLYGVLLPCRALIPKFKQTRRGKILILSGGGATAPLPSISAYAASKAAVVRLMETLAEELREYAIDVNAIAPGAMNTRLLDEALEAGPEKLGDACYRRLLKQQESGGAPPQKAAGLAVYLASAESSGITGKLISAQWDPWQTLHEHRQDLASDIYTLRRIIPEDRGKTWPS
jgi:NAD(P)-dependent dehydrogenase (short-subunit alcohol dehydrogenase family)